MTGIERLRKLAGDYKNLSTKQDYIGINTRREADLLCDIADQIERERACDSDTAENIRLIVGRVIDDMERHISGVEGMEDSTVARWARALREALGATVSRHESDDVADSPYDAILPEDREAVAWVRGHGGLDAVKKLLDWVVGHCSTRQQLDFDFWLSGRVMHELGFEEDMADRDEVERRLLARLMPEGCDWEFLKLHMSNLRGFMLDVMDRLGVDKSDSDAPEIVFDVLDRRLMPEGMEWPRHESGELVGFGDLFEGEGEPLTCHSVTVNDHGDFCLNDTWFKSGQRVKRPAPKVLDADGVEVEVGDDLYSVEGMLKFHVSAIDKKSGRIATEAMFALDKWADPKMYTHRAPVLAADGRPLRVGETVWGTGREVHEYVVLGQPGLGGGVGRFKVACHDVTDDIDCDCDPSQLTHERPVADSWERLEEDAKKGSCNYFGCDANGCHGCPAYGWSVTRGGNGCGNAKMADLMRRAKELAGRDA